jgi:hypothetical protein
MEVQAIRNQVMEMCAYPRVRRKKKLKMISNNMNKILHQCIGQEERCSTMDHMEKSMQGLINLQVSIGR